MIATRPRPRRPTALCAVKTPHTRGIDRITSPITGGDGTTTTASTTA